MNERKHYGFKDRVKELGYRAQALKWPLREDIDSLMQNLRKTYIAVESIGSVEMMHYTAVIVMFASCLTSIELELRDWIADGHIMFLSFKPSVKAAIKSHSAKLQEISDYIKKAIDEERLQRLEVPREALLLEADPEVFTRPSPLKPVLTMISEIQPASDWVIETSSIQMSLIKSNVLPSHLCPPIKTQGVYIVQKKLWAQHYYLAGKRCPFPEPHEARERFAKHVELLKSMSHPNIIPLLGMCIYNDSKAIPAEVELLTPWMKNCTVFHYLKINANPNRLKLINDVALGLKYLHEKGVVHRNVKPENILVDLSGNAILSGLSRVRAIEDALCRTESTEINVEDLRWAHLDAGTSLSKEDDIWSWSMTALAILSGEPPFPQIKEWSQAAIRSVFTLGVRPSPENYLPQEVASPAVWKILEACWKEPKAKRIPVDDILNDLGAEMRKNGWDPALKSTRILDWEVPFSF